MYKNIEQDISNVLMILLKQLLMDLVVWEKY